MLSSSRTEQEARIGGRAGRRQQEMSRARSVVEMVGRDEERNEGIWLGVDELERRRCVVPRCIHESMNSCINELDRRSRGGAGEEQQESVCLVCLVCLTEVNPSEFRRRGRGR